MSVYTEPGRGRKQCPSCTSYVGVRNHNCEKCGHEFVQGASTSTPSEPVEVTTYDGPGRGRKQCPSCSKYVGVRNHKCVCGYEFNGSAAVVADDEEDEKPSENTRQVPIVRPTVVDTGLDNGYINGTTLIPAGPCPVELTGTSASIVRQCERDVRAAYQKKEQRKLAKSALEYWVQRFYMHGSDEYNVVCSAID